MQPFDGTSTWLIRRCGDSRLRMSGVRVIASWQALQAEPVQPRRLPDGLLVVKHRGEIDFDLSVVEISTYPEPRVGATVFADGCAQPIG